MDTTTILITLINVKLHIGFLFTVVGKFIYRQNQLLVLLL
jgi:hypothetical protein